MNATLLEKLRENFPYSSFRPGQAETLEVLAAGGSALSLLPTGQGKSLIYQFMAKTEPGLVLVISPLIALMQDQAAKATALGIDTGFVNSNVASDEREKRLKRLAEGRYKMFLVTPERFRKENFREAVAKRDVSLMVVDEAHCASLWGHDFRPDFAKLGEIRALLGNPRVLAVTATATPEVQKDIRKILRFAESDPTIFAGLERPNLSLNVTEAYGLEEKLTELKREIEESPGTTIVYFTLIDTLMKAAREFERAGTRPLQYHGDLPPGLRRKNLKSFMEDEAPLMFATPAFGLGIDRPDVRLLAHMEMPGSLEAYFQEAGRAGRDGNDARAVLFLDEEDVSIQMEFLKWSHPEESFLMKVYDLIASRRGEVDQGGFDFLREQMVFKSKRDYRVEAAVNIMERWGALESSDDPFPFRAVSPPTKEMIAAEMSGERLKNQNMKLLQMLRFAKDTEKCRMRTIHEYFGVMDSDDCGVCDNCR